jgi:hypothetical protein
LGFILAFPLLHKHNTHGSEVSFPKAGRVSSNTSLERFGDWIVAGLTGVALFSLGGFGPELHSSGLAVGRFVFLHFDSVATAKKVFISNVDMPFA